MISALSPQKVTKGKQPSPSRKGKERVEKSVPKSKNPDARTCKFCITMGSGTGMVVKFQDDNETAGVLFPDKDVRLCD